MPCKGFTPCRAHPHTHTICKGPTMNTQPHTISNTTTVHIYSDPTTLQVSHALWLQTTHLPATMPYLADGGDPGKPGEGGIRAMVAFAVAMVHSVEYAPDHQPVDAQGQPATWPALPLVMSGDSPELLARLAVVLSWPTSALKSITEKLNEILQVDVQLEGN